MKIVFIYGLPGVGKLTVANALSRKTGLKLFHNHMVLNLIIDIFGREIQPIVQLRERIWLDFFKQAALLNLKGIIFTFCFDKYLSRDFLIKLENAISTRGSICYVELTCSNEALKERIQQQSRKSFNKLQNFSDLIKQVKDKSFYVPKLKKDVLAVDNSNVSPEEMAIRIMKRFHLAAK